MDEPKEPTITLPLTSFLNILWGYKKGAELRDRAVPGKEIANVLASIPNIESYLHVQKQEEGYEDVIWQKDEWMKSGRRLEQRKVELDKLFTGIDKVIETLKPKLYPLNREAIRVFASNLILEKDWTTLESLGVDTTEMK